MRVGTLYAALPLPLRESYTRMPNCLVRGLSEINAAPAASRHSGATCMTIPPKVASRNYRCIFFVCLKWTDMILTDRFLWHAVLYALLMGKRKFHRNGLMVFCVCRTSYNVVRFFQSSIVFIQINENISSKHRVLHTYSKHKCCSTRNT